MRHPGCPLPTPARLPRAGALGSCEGSQCLSFCGDLPCPGFESFFPSPFSSASPWQSVLLVQIPIFLGGVGHISRELAQPNRVRDGRVNRARASSKGEASPSSWEMLGARAESLRGLWPGGQGTGGPRPMRAKYYAGGFSLVEYLPYPLALPQRGF